MITPGSISDDFTDTDAAEAGRGRSPLVKIISILTAVAITAAMLIGFLIWRKHQEESVSVAPRSQSNAARPALPVKVQVFTDEPVRKGPQAIVTGTVQNISTDQLANLSIELELTRRKDAGVEVRSLEVEPKELAPDQKGRYALTLTGDYRSVKLLNVKSGPGSDLIGFKTAPGTPRPVEHPQQTTRTIIVDRPSAPRKGEEFINTPDNPDRIP